MYYYLYQITNKLDGKIYVGVHQTDNLNDGYMGSGVLIKRAIKKHGIENFEKDILEIFDTPADMFLREAELVTNSFVNDPNTYNLGCGGYGGTIEQNRQPFNGPHTAKAKQKISLSRIGVPRTEETKQRIRDNHWAVVNADEQRQHASAAGKNRMVGCEEEVRRKKEVLSQAMKNVNEHRKLQGVQHPVCGIVRDTVKCPYCDKVGAKNTMLRWHFENCKEKQRCD